MFTFDKTYPASKLHFGICIVEIESPLQYAKIIWEKIKSCGKGLQLRERKDYQQLWGILTSQQSHVSSVEFWDFLKLQGAWCGLKLIMLRCHTILGSVRLYCLHPRELPCTLLRLLVALYVYGQQNNISSFVFHKKNKKIKCTHNGIEFWSGEIHS